MPMMHNEEMVGPCGVLMAAAPLASKLAISFPRYTSFGHLFQCITWLICFWPLLFEVRFTHSMEILQHPPTFI
jgi:hypothetical protein